MSERPNRKLDVQRLTKLALPELPSLIAGTVALTIASAITLSYPVVVQHIIDGIGEGGGYDLVNNATMLLLGLFLVGSAFGAARAWLFTVAGERVVARLREQLYGSIVNQEVAFFDERRTGELTNRLAADTTVLQNTVTVNVSMLLRFIIMGIGAIGFLFYTNWQLTLLTLAVVPVVAIGAGVFGRRLRGLSRDVQDALARATEVAEETISGIRTVRAFAREDAETARYGEAVDESFQLAKGRAVVIALFRWLVGFAGYSAIGLVLWYGGRLLIDGAMTIGELTSYLLYTLTAAMSIGALSGLYEDFMKALGASERVFELLDREPSGHTGTDQPASVDGGVLFQGVSFAYPSRQDMPVLVDFDLALDQGEVVALVGPSGSGKSTVAALISRFYDPDTGRISLDGRPYEDLDSSWLRRQVGVVSQEPILFATSIKDNIRYGRPTATDAEVEAAANAANAHDFVMGFPEGYDTLVGERGVKLSGGQKQRVAIARALLKDPRVLVLDEATSALDAESEHLVQDALDRLMEGRTTLVIAHRLSTVKEADRVCVLDGGRIVQQGTHSELVSTDGLYRRLVERQFAAA
ncbi:MAG: ATP-binding cassette domain-containing protein [Proteobacteria bacterium]|nr:ATP-binding cassette domain-containing protein [Pseudomonadota bacterium]MCP4921598.1 ATP-binding cassette domain-containing protein [Pseudomonadota bacterium]